MSRHNTTSSSLRLLVGLCASVLLPFGSAAANPNVGLDSTQTGISSAVQWMLDHDVPYAIFVQGPSTGWLDYWPTTVMAQNPGLWTFPERKVGLTITSWTGKPVDPNSPLGTSIPPYPAPPGSDPVPGSTMDYWYQLRIGRAISTLYYSFYPNYDQNLALSQGFFLGQNKKPDPAKPGGVLAIEAGGLAFQIPGGWQYEYWFSNPASQPVTFEFQLSEYFNHHLHHEFDIIQADATFSWDQPLLAPHVDPHNYDWRSLTLAAGASVMVGFKDIHAPALASWAIKDTDSGVYYSLNGLPVPAVPEPGTWMMLFAGLITLTVRHLRLKS